MYHLRVVVRIFPPDPQRYVSVDAYDNAMLVLPGRKFEYTGKIAIETAMADTRARLQDRRRSIEERLKFQSSRPVTEASGQSELLDISSILE